VWKRAIQNFETVLKVNIIYKLVKPGCDTNITGPKLSYKVV